MTDTLYGEIPKKYWDGPEMVEYLRSLTDPTEGDRFTLIFLEMRQRARDRFKDSKNG